MGVGSRRRLRHSTPFEPDVGDVLPWTSLMANGIDVLIGTGLGDCYLRPLPAFPGYLKLYTHALGILPHSFDQH